ncbi:CHAP domain-containing protein [Roseomonas gilardii]|uniref:CHAP domain-containing protein n=1 Tax=Roseomonas gilardii TaxID=257708 RepID=A0ABU3MEB6_9PROT|nr:CHAP domain-containing protein [Roseomonas gilardii]MDT8331283.1 CHAP domain-containing protein [Roseomonas gilardii]
MALTLPGGAEAAQQKGAKAARHGTTAHVAKTLNVTPNFRNTSLKARSSRVHEGTVRNAMFTGSISCVPYARMVSGIQVTGNGYQWWGNAAGLYERGQRPEPGSVLAFRSSGGMRLGHVAVVQRIVNGREIEIEHANWEGPGIRKGTVMRNVSVIDVSPRNDWTAVRVQVGRSDESFGRVYPTYGFIHNRPIGASPRINYARSQGFEEVAEAPASNRPLDITVRNTGR